MDKTPSGNDLIDVNRDGGDGPYDFAFVLLDRFTLVAFASALDCLRQANRMSGQTLYRWRLYSADGAPAQASSAIPVGVDGSFQDLADHPVSRDLRLLVCGGSDIAQSTTPDLINLLRRMSRRRVTLGALCTATFCLARAGLLRDHEAVIHWENHDSFREEFADIRLSRGVYRADDGLLLSAGGTTSIDLMLHVIARDFGAALSNAVADQMIYTTMRSPADQQRLSVPSRIGVRHPRLARVIEIMESHIEDPISPAILARDVGMSTRQLERLFRQYLNRSPKHYYLELRLQKARNLLLQTEMSVINVALACGFSSPSHFSKCYRSHYDVTPYRERGARASS